MNKQKSFLTIAIMVLTVTMTNCRKDVSLPSPEYKKMFGQWEWLGSSGGFAGITLKPEDGHTMIIEFNENGICKSFENGKKKGKSKYSFTEGTSIYNGEKAVFIKFVETGLFDFHKTSSLMLIEFRGQDTLYLSDNMRDGYRSAYIRK